MNLNQNDMEPLEVWFKARQQDVQQFPNRKNDYFDRYWMIKQYCAEKIYPYVGAGTSAEDGGVYTDHSLDHFNAVIRYTGKLLGVPNDLTQITDAKLALTPYEVFITLVSILLHDAGNIEGRRNHEKKPLKIFTGMGELACHDQFEAIPIAEIAQAHGGKIVSVDGSESKDTISSLREHNTYLSVSFRPRLIAAIVRFADEICEDRTRAARYLLQNNVLPKKSEIFHRYANSISSVDVDLKSKWVSIKYEIFCDDVACKYGKDNGLGGNDEQYLIDEINSRLEKMYCEMLYCKYHMIEASHINQIRATVIIYSSLNSELHGSAIMENVFELKESGYPTGAFSFDKIYPDWCGEKINIKLSEPKGVSE